MEVSAVGLPAGQPAYIALLMRDIGRRLASKDGATSLQSALAAVVEQSGKTSLRALVRDTVGLVERHDIDAALQLSDGMVPRRRKFFRLSGRASTRNLRSMNGRAFTGRR